MFNIIGDYNLIINRAFLLHNNVYFIVNVFVNFSNKKIERYMFIIFLYRKNKL